MAPSPLNDTTQAVDSEEEGQCPTMDRWWLKESKNRRSMRRCCSRGIPIIKCPPARLHNWNFKHSRQSSLTSSDSAGVAGLSVSWGSDSNSSASLTAIGSSNCESCSDWLSSSSDCCDWLMPSGSDSSMASAGEGSLQTQWAWLYQWVKISQRNSDSVSKWMGGWLVGQ